MHVLKFQAKLSSYIHGIRDIDKKDIILLGDFNWNAGSNGGNGSEFIEEIAFEFGLKQIIECPTRTGSNCQSIIDLIFTNASNILRSGC